MKKIRMGILGTASIARRFMVPAMLQMKELFGVAWIASRDPAKAKQFAEESGIGSFPGYSELVGSEEIDAVYIPLPNALHYEWVDRALSSGKHVLCEKSLACSLDEAEKLVAKAREKGLLLMENFQFRFHSQMTTLLEILDSGKIGDIRSVRSSFGFPPFPDPGNIRYSPELGGGALLDTGAYPVKISQVLLGQGLRVQAADLFYDPVKRVDLWGGAYLSDTGTSRFSQIAFGFDHYYQCSVEIWGSRGKLTANRIFTAPPGFSPQVILETGEGREEVSLPPDNHFMKLLHYFHSRVTDGDTEGELMQNLHQAMLIQQIKELAHGK